MQLAKNRIEDAVKQYIKMFPAEYDAFLQSQRMKEENKKNDWAEFQGTSQMVRHLIDMPETMYFALKQSLTQEEIDWFYGKGDYMGKREGMSWFVKRFPQFKITKDF